MENLKQEIFSGFEIVPKTIVKSKHRYICRTSDGVKVIQKTTAKDNDILVGEIIKNGLQENDYPVYDKFYISTQGTPFFLFDNEKYVMTDYLETLDSDFSNGRDVIDVIKATALFHRLSKNIDVEINKNIDVLNIYKKQLANFKNVKKCISSKSSFSEFDIIFIKNYDYFYKKATNALDTLRELFENDSFKKYSQILCHNNIKEETAVKYHNKTSLISFENASKGLFISDFSDIINRYIRKHNPPVINFNVILETYFKINPLSDNGIKILQAILKFPAKYIKICCDFHSKGMPFVPNSVVNHLKCIISQKNIFENYAKYL